LNALRRSRPARSARPPCAGRPHACKALCIVKPLLTERKRLITAVGHFIHGLVVAPGFIELHAHAPDSNRWIDKYTERRASALVDLKRQLEEDSA